MKSGKSMLSKAIAMMSLFTPEGAASIKHNPGGAWWFQGMPLPYDPRKAHGKKGNSRTEWTTKMLAEVSRG